MSTWQQPVPPAASRQRTELVERVAARVVGRDRYLPGMRTYIAECDPAARADVVVDAEDLAAPHLLRPGP